MSLPKVIVHPEMGQYGGRKLPSPSALAHHFTCLGVPYRLSRKLSYHFYKWYKSEGPESFNKRIKNLLTELLSGTKAPWIHRVGKRSWVLHDLRSLPLRVQVRVLRVNTFLVLRRVSPTQERKFLGSLSAPPVDLGEHREWLLSEDIRKLSVKKFSPPSFENLVYQLSKNRNLPRLQLDGSFKVVKGNTDFSLRDFNFILFDFARRGWHKVLNGLPEAADPRSFATGVPSGDSPNYAIGRISPIQEPGCKLRAVANPSVVWQWALKPIGDTLFDILKQLPRDYTHNQDSALPVIQQWMKSKGSNNSDDSNTSTAKPLEPLHAIDLSDATNLFPLSYQLCVLRHVLGAEYEEQILMFEHASKGDWELSHGFITRGKVRWTKGQPLGLYPSFASFALSHYVLLDGLRATHGGEFAIVGDDVVIHGNDLHTAYLEALSDLQIEHSPEKSMTSMEMTEFVGTIIRKGGWFKKGKEGTINAQTSLSRLFRHGESEFQYLRKLIVGSPKEVMAPIARALFVYDCYPTYMGGGGHVNFNVTNLIPNQDEPVLLKQHTYRGLPHELLSVLLKKLNDSVFPLWKSWPYQSLVPTSLRFSENVSSIPNIPRKGDGRKLIARVVKQAGESERKLWLTNRFLS